MGGIKMTLRYMNRLYTLIFKREISFISAISICLIIFSIPVDAIKDSDFNAYTEDQENISGSKKLIVCPEGCNFSSIQTAIDSADRGDTIEVQNGTYFENVDINKKIILIGVGWPVVDAGGRGSVITLTTGKSTIKGFVIKGSGKEETSSGILIKSNDNIIRNNNVSNNWNGFYLENSGNNRLNGNNASYNRNAGIYLAYSRNNVLSGNIALKNSFGIYVSSSEYNALDHNIMKKNDYNFYLDGYFDSNFQNEIDKSNLVDGKPIYYIKGARNTVYDSSTNAGTFYCINCFNVTLKDLILNKNSLGVFFWNTTFSKIQNIKASKNFDGIMISSSSNITLKGNNVSKNSRGLVVLDSKNNKLNGNMASNNEDGIDLLSSSDNILVNNVMKGNENNFDLDGYSDPDFENEIDMSNLVDGKPIYYIKRGKNATYDSSTNAGTFYCINCFNVTIKDLNLSNNGCGVFFWNTTFSKIQNVMAHNISNAIGLSSSTNNKLSGNIAYNGSIFLYYSRRNTVNNNSAGIYLDSSTKNILSGNYANNIGYAGIHLSYYSNKNTLSGNNASNNIVGIYLDSSSKNILKNNAMTGNKHNFILVGYINSSFKNQIDRSNLVNGKPVYYITGAANKLYDSSSNAGTFYCIDCLNVTIKDLNLANNGYGVFFWNTTSSKIQNVKAQYNLYAGISLSSYSNNNTLKGINASNNDFSGGIRLDNSNNNTLKGSIVSNNTYTGIRLDFSNDNRLNNNVVSDNNYGGIRLGFSGNNNLNGNEIFNNDYGIYLDSSSNNLLTRNNVSKSDIGIYLDSSSCATQSSNIIESKGCYFIAPENNLIYDNFFNNRINTNAISNNGIYSTDNKWNITKTKGINIIGGPFIGGNFWGNPKGTGFSQKCRDANNNGICDAEYAIDSNNIDYLPLANYIAAKLTIISPNGGETWVQNSLYKIKWFFTGNPGSFVKIQLMKNGSTFRTIRSNTSNDGSFAWKVSSSITPGTDYKIRISSKSNKTIADIGDENFTILSQYT